MKHILIAVIILVSLLTFSCKEDEEVTNLNLITSHTWNSDSLLVNNMDASYPGGLLEAFKGEANFNADGTGSFGKYIGTWAFAEMETKIILSSDSLAFPLTTNIELLNEEALKVTTVFPNLLDAANPYNIRMTFK